MLALLARKNKIPPGSEAELSTVVIGDFCLVEAFELGKNERKKQETEEGMIGKFAQWQEINKYLNRALFLEPN